MTDLFCHAIFILERVLSMSSTTSLDKLKKLVMAAMFVAVAYVFRFIFHFNAMFLTFEFKDAVIAIGAMFLGPLWGVGIAIAVALLEFFTISMSITGVYGLIMNILAASVYAGAAGLVYKYRRTMAGAMWSLGASTAVLVAVMLPANLLITPYFMGGSVEEVIVLIPKLLFPFNLIKGVMNSGVVLLLYKAVTRALRAVKLADCAVTQKNIGGETGGKKAKWLVPLVACLLILLSCLFFFLFLHGNISFGK
jgi:riboflavin transporter FmnP